MAQNRFIREVEVVAQNRFIREVEVVACQKNASNQVVHSKLNRKECPCHECVFGRCISIVEC